MALHYLVDGYNVLFAMREIPPGSWQDKRAVFLRALKSRQPQGQNAMTVIFDSREGPGSRSKEGAIEVVYTAGETADERIIDLVRSAPYPRALVVVSNDKGIRLMLKGTGAQFMSATDFVEKIEGKPAPTRPNNRLQERDAITEELRAKWLTK